MYPFIFSYLSLIVLSLFTANITSVMYLITSYVTSTVFVSRACFWVVNHYRKHTLSKTLFFKHKGSLSFFTILPILLIVFLFGWLFLVFHHHHLLLFCPKFHFIDTRHTLNYTFDLTLLSLIKHYICLFHVYSQARIDIFMVKLIPRFIFLRVFLIGFYKFTLALVLCI